MTSAERTLQAQAAVHSSWANTTDRTARTAPARAARDATFLTAAGGDPIRAAHLRKAHFIQLQYLSMKNRRKSKEATAAAELAEAELAELGGEVLA